MKRNKFTQTLGALVFGAALVCLAPASQAISVTFGTPYEGNSWLQPVNVFGGGFDAFMATIVSDTGAGPFEAPGALDFVVDGGSGFNDWTTSGTWVPVPGTDPLVSTASSFTAQSEFGFGIPQSNLDFTLAFYGDIFQDVTVDLQFMLGGVPLEGGLVQFVHTGSTDAPVPDGGATFSLLGLSLMGMVWLRRKAA